MFDLNDINIPQCFYEFELMLHPYYLCCNEHDKEEIEKVISDQFLIRSFSNEVIEPGKMIIIDRKKAEKGIFDIDTVVEEDIRILR